MSITVGPYTFEGPYGALASFRHQAGVYVVLCATGTQYVVLDVGESSDIRTRLGNHERSGCWSRNCSGQVVAAVLYTPGLQQAARVSIEQQVRAQFSPACGVI